MHLTRRQSIFIALALLVAFFGAAVFSLSGRNRFQHGDQVAEATPIPVASIEGAADATPGTVLRLDKFHRVETRDGKKVWEIFADQGRYLPQSNNVVVSNGTLWLYRPNGDVVRMKAQNATLALNGAELSEANVSGSVEVQLNETTTIYTEEALYDYVNKKVETPALVRVETPRLELTGIGMNADLESESFTLLADVKTLIKPEATPTPEVPASTETPQTAATEE